MFILTVLGKEREGAYSVINEDGEHVLYLFEHEDDASRYAMMLEDNGTPEMHVIEVEDSAIIDACVAQDYNYTVITPNAIVIPPDTEHDVI